MSKVTELVNGGGKTMPQSLLISVTSINGKINVLGGRSLQNASRVTGLLESWLCWKSLKSTLAPHVTLQAFSA